jgi:hypothetical protein
MEGIITAVGALVDDGAGAGHGQILWQEMRVLGWVTPVFENILLSQDLYSDVIEKACLTWTTGWAKFMEWKYPVEVVVTSPKIFKGAGIIEAAATLWAGWPGEKLVGESFEATTALHHTRLALGIC